MPPSKKRSKQTKNTVTPHKGQAAVILPPDERAFMEQELLRKGGSRTQFVADLVKKARVEAATRPATFVDAEVVAVQESPDYSARTKPADCDVGVVTGPDGNIKSVEARSDRFPAFERPPFPGTKHIPDPRDQSLPPKEQRETWRAFLTRISNEGSDYLRILDDIARGKPHVNVLPPNAAGQSETYTVFPSLELRANVAVQLHTVLHGKAPNAERIHYAEEAAMKHKGLLDQRRKELTEKAGLAQRSTEELFAEIETIKKTLLLTGGGPLSPVDLEPSKAAVPTEIPASPAPAPAPVASQPSAPSPSPTATTPSKASSSLPDVRSAFAGYRRGSG